MTCTLYAIYSYSPGFIDSIAWSNQHMMTIRAGRENQWRRFHLAHDIPTEFVSYVEDLAAHIELDLKASKGFDDAATAAFEEVDASEVPKPERFNAETAITILLDLWERAPQLRAWAKRRVDR
jgi:hypothetical protein